MFGMLIFGLLIILLLVEFALGFTSVILLLIKIWPEEGMLMLFILLIFGFEFGLLFPLKIKNS